VGGWWRARPEPEFRFGICYFDERWGWLSDRGAVPTHYLISVPVAFVTGAIIHGQVTDPPAPVLPFEPEAEAVQPEATPATDRA